MIKAFMISKPGFTPSEFYVTDSGRVYCYNPELGFIRHPKRLDLIKEHFVNCLFEGFTVENISDTIDDSRLAIITDLIKKEDNGS